MFLLRCLCLAALCLLLPLSSCRRPSQKAPAQGAPAQGGAPAQPAKEPGGALEPGPGTVSSPLKVATLMSRAHFAFRAVDDQQLAWHDTLTARVSGGALTVTPQQTRRNMGRSGRQLSELVVGAPVTVRLAGITKGGRPLSLSPGPAAVAPDGAVVRDLGGVKERYVNGEAGVTMVWTFASAPAGGGDLELRLRVSGARHVGSTGSGQHYAVRSGDLGLRVGPAVWKDAAGKAKPREVRRVGSELRFSVPGRFVTTGVTPLRMELTLTPEVGLDRPVRGPLRVNQEEPAVVALGGGGAMVVWRDSRGGRYHDIYAARVSAGGRVLDPSGLLVRHSAVSTDRPVVAAGEGGELLVVWDEVRQPRTGFDIMAARVTGAGTVLDPDGVLICGAPGSQVRPQVSFGDGQYFVVWEDKRGGGQSEIHGARVGAGGKVLDPGGFVLNKAGRHKKHPALCHSKGQALVVWTDRRGNQGPDIFGARVGAGGEVLDPEGFAIGAGPGDQSFPAVGCDGSGYMVLWQDHQPGRETGTDIFGARVDAGGKVLDAGGRGLVRASGDQEQPALVWSREASAYLAVWQDRRASNQVDIYGARLNPRGRMLEGGGRIISAARSFQERPAVAWGAGAFWVAWQDRRHGDSYDIYGARVSAGGKLQDASGFNISGGARAQVFLRLASGGAGAMAAWRDFRGDGHGDIVGARLVQDGATQRVEDGAGIDLSRAPRTQQSPDLASAGERYLVVWQDRGKDRAGDIMAALVNSGTGALDKAPITVSAGGHAEGEPAVGWAGESFIVVWRRGPKGGQGGGLLGARVSLAGEVLDRDPVVLSAGGHQDRPRLAAGLKSQLLLVFEDRRADKAGDISGAVISGAGELKVLTPGGVTVSGGQGAQSWPAASRLGDGYLVAWQDERAGADGADIYAARVSAGGKVLDSEGVVLARAPGAQQAPAVAWDGARALVVWQDLRGADGPNIFGAMVSGGQRLSPSPAGGLVLAGDKGGGLSPTLCNINTGGFLLGYQRLGAAETSWLEVRRVGAVVTPTGR